MPCLLKSEIKVNSPNLESFYMDMKKIKRFALLLIMASLAVNVQAQLEQAVKKIFAVMGLAVKCGETVTIAADGADEFDLALSRCVLCIA